MSDFDDNMAAVVAFFNDQTPKTTDAAKVKDSFAAWYSTLGWLAKNVDTVATWNTARNFRTEYNRANATTTAEKEAVENVELLGLTSEDITGDEVSAQTSGGLYAVPKKPLVPPEYKIPAIIAVVGGVLIFAYGLSTAIPTAIASLALKKREK